MSTMTDVERLRNVERRLKVLERLFVEFRRTNAHTAVGGEAWAQSDQDAIDEARHS